MITPKQVQNKHVLLRADLDLPIKNSQITNNFRLKALLPTLTFCLKHAPKVLIIGHQGRPKQKNRKNSLLPVLNELKSLIHQSISLISNPNRVGQWQKTNSPLAMLENLRFFSGEKDSINGQFSAQISQDSEIYLYDAFPHFHSSVSLQKIPEILPTYTGFQFDKEIKNLQKITKNPDKPVLLILSGAKKDKLKLLPSLLDSFDEVLIGGSIVIEADLSSLSPSKSKKITLASLVSSQKDITPNSASEFTQKIAKAGTVVLNGPLGMFEDERYAQGTKAVLQALKDASAFTLVGGGDTISAISQLGFNYPDFDFVSTGGGAMLEFLKSGTHPLLTILQKKSKQAKIKSIV